jgi:AAA domain-containing protein
MTEPEPRSLHLHTLDSLITDLVSGRPVLTGAAKEFALQDERTRSALDWYRKKGPSEWAANVTAQHGEDLVDAILLKPPELPALPARPAHANTRRLRLKMMAAHRFAGLHKFGTPGAAPDNYVHEFTSPLTLFEGRNGSGKTSLLNAIIWVLTGEILRPQREPEPAEDFDCWVAPENEDDEQSTHKLSSLTPMPNVDQYRPDQPWVPSDTWVELTFADEIGAELPAIRRSLSRTPQGKPKESPPDLSVLGVDPIALRIGTVMPALLPLIKVGSESELGRAVSQLTGLAALVDLAEHVRRAKTKIDKEFVKAKASDRDRADLDYGVAKADLGNILLEHPTLNPTQTIPQPSDDKAIEGTLDQITRHFEDAKASAYQSARDILGKRFDPTNQALLSELERSIGRALERVSQPQNLPSAARLEALRQLKTEQLEAAEAKSRDILLEAKTLDALAQNPTTAARTRLYARVATWIADHPDPQRKDDICVVCGGSLQHALDPATGRPVTKHLHEAASDAVLLSQTLARWEENVLGELMRSLPEALRAETATDPPEHPRDLLRAAISDELFSFEPFQGVLADLRTQTASAFDLAANNCPTLASPSQIALPTGCTALSQALKRLDAAIRLARWRQGNDRTVQEIVTRVLGRAPKEAEPSERATLTGKLLGLEATVKAAKPISDAFTQCSRLKQHLRTRRAAEKRLNEYATASAALANLASLWKLADEQVNQLRKTLRKDAATWRSRIYLGAFPDTAQELIDTGMGRKGELDLVVQAGGVAAPAQHVTNASALRASLVAFFFAFWVHVLKERGGLTTLVLDDLQELLDDENRERLAAALTHLVDAGAQVVLTSYDPRFPPVSPASQLRAASNTSGCTPRRGNNRSSEPRRRSQPSSSAKNSSMSTEMRRSPRATSQTAAESSLNPGLATCSTTRVMRRGQSPTKTRRSPPSSNAYAR